MLLSAMNLNIGKRIFFIQSMINKITQNIFYLITYFMLILSNI